MFEKEITKASSELNRVVQDAETRLNGIVKETLDRINGAKITVSPITINVEMPEVKKEEPVQEQ